METEYPKAMTYDEREELKRFARRGKNLEEVVIMIANWMSCGVDVTFTGYAANWIAANNTGNLEAMASTWPLTGPRMIADDSTAWGSAA
ncbi:MAG TPA: hypothetical protein PLA97_16180 [Rubrivivax sp.]|mgnify:CR=1 FL=1|nr:hypothetical protein [Rubrivivax sp.]